ncbi:adenosylcobinamide-GDP ribazoletransferase [Thalassobius sp. Cn5-15]|nr:adenosylcobinamide-GDP ribazoletransferase [Thalassobius sp. Cn5-15]MCG7491948.1 adenosylcobinamide-GDP ribazoletransferase [Thalassobius sp. Cn5-15]
MTENDSRRLALSDIGVSLALLSRIPIPLDRTWFKRGARAAWAYPLTGVLIGCIASVAATIAVITGIDSQLTALLILSLSVLITGAMHEDGLADCADGFWGGWTRERRLEIMKDSQIGTYGVLALILCFGLRWWGLTQLLDAGAIWALVAIATLSRAAMSAVMAALPHARDTGLSHSQGRPDALTAGIAAAIAIAVASLTLGANIWIALPATLLAASTAALIARAKIGGQTGDVLGATQQSSEVFMFIALFAL